jgi:hypothetical protein
MHPSTVVLVILAALFEVYIFFALTYAALLRHGGRKYTRRVRDVLLFKL